MNITSGVLGSSANFRSFRPSFVILSEKSPEDRSFFFLATIHQPRIHSNPQGITNRGKIGNREVVGYGLNGHLCYSDQTDCPFPAIRFRESTPEILALREKERGDWRRLSIEEKKTLYRASFCQTFAEIDAPTGDWKSVIAIFGFCISSALWLWVYTHIFVHTKAPKTFSEERRAAQYWRQEAINNQPFSGNYKPPNADKYKPVPNVSNVESS